MRGNVRIWLPTLALMLTVALFLRSSHVDCNGPQCGHNVYFSASDIENTSPNSESSLPNIQHSFNPFRKITNGISPKKVSKLEAGQTLSPFRLFSPSGRYVFQLHDSGSLSLVDTKTEAELFASDTEYYWPVKWHVELTENGELLLSWTNETAPPYRATPWSSYFLPNCDPVEADDEKPVLELLDSGELHISVGSKTTCLIHRAADDKGRLAVILSGFLRTYLKTCEEQNNKLIKTWTGSGGVDVHVFTYLEDAFHPPDDPVNVASIKKNLESCFGDALKTVEVRELKSVAENVQKPPKSVTTASCHVERLSHQLSQWKTLYLASQQVQRYMLAEGVSYDYIYRGRLDMSFWGNTPPLSSLKVPENGIIAPRIAPDWTWYTMLPNGELRAGVGDQTAFGRPNAMFTYLSLYRDFISMRALEKETAKWKSHNTHSRHKDDPNKEDCTPEGTLSYWLGLNGVTVKTDWRFEIGLLREDGTVKDTCPIDRNWLCPDFVPKANEDGTLSW